MSDKAKGHLSAKAQLEIRTADSMEFMAHRADVRSESQRTGDGNAA
jgi:hypothetical protein